jgi:hypothetical protein
MLLVVFSACHSQSVRIGMCVFQCREFSRLVCFCCVVLSHHPQCTLVFVCVSLCARWWVCLPHHQSPQPHNRTGEQCRSHRGFRGRWRRCARCGHSASRSRCCVCIATRSFVRVRWSVWTRSETSTCDLYVCVCVCLSALLKCVCVCVCVCVCFFLFFFPLFSLVVVCALLASPRSPSTIVQDFTHSLTHSHTYTLTLTLTHKQSHSRSYPHNTRKDTTRIPVTQWVVIVG